MDEAQRMLCKRFLGLPASLCQDESPDTTESKTTGAVKGGDKGMLTLFFGVH